MASEAPDGGCECPWDGCTRSFEDERRVKIHHAKSHGVKLTVTDSVCDQCGGDFEARIRSDRDTDQRFCGKECRLEWMRTWEGESHPRYNSSEVTCAHCGTVRTRPEYRLREGKRYYCNPTCFGQWRSENLTGKDSHHYASVEVECETCGGPITKPPSRIDGRSHFCSPRCVGAWLSAEKVGENSPSWKGGHANYYGPNWLRQRRLARERDGHVCQDSECSVTADEHREVWGENLHVHHIVRFHDFDDYKEANQLSNLVTLCRPHHLGKWENLPGLRPDTGMR